MKNKILLCLLMVSVVSFSQKKRSTKVGLTSIAELQLASYDKDTTANALVLYEHANTYMSEKYDLDFKTDFYYRIKLFTSTAFNRATVKVKLYKKEKIREIEAYSYNLENGTIVKTKLLASDVYTKDLDKNWTEVTFTIPAIKEGTVIEYQYSVISPYSRVDDWYFQSNTPKLKSDFSISYLGNYQFNSRLTGFLKFQRNEQKVEKKCLYFPGIGRGDCANIFYGMDHIPAFEEEDYMLSKENYISKLSFDLISITQADGRKKKYTETWKDADKSFKNDFFDGQIAKDYIFAKILPKNLLAIEDAFHKAQNIYKYIQNRFSWNGYYWTQDQINLKEIYKERVGGVDVINLSLYNSLQAANIESYLVMVATRDRAQPTRLYPVRTDFNYMIVKAIINNKTYFLDATDKFLSFGQIPLRTLNGEGRVLDFDKGSYWELIKPMKNASTKIMATITMDTTLMFTGSINVEKKGYHALETRHEYSDNGESSYLENLENTSIDLEIEEYKIENFKELEKSLVEELKIESDQPEYSNGSILINPFLYYRISENPFKFKTRNYPVDFGHPIKYTYILTLRIPKEYEVVKKPSSKGIKLPNNGGTFLLNVGDVRDGKITLSYRYQLKKHLFSAEEYHYLKEFFNEIIKIHTTYIELKKT